MPLHLVDWWGGGGGGSSSFLKFLSGCYYFCRFSVILWNNYLSFVWWPLLSPLTIPEGISSSLSCLPHTLKSRDTSYDLQVRKGEITGETNKGWWEKLAIEQVSSVLSGVRMECIAISILKAVNGAAQLVNFRLKVPATAIFYVVTSGGVYNSTILRQNSPFTLNWWKAMKNRELDIQVIRGSEPEGCRFDTWAAQRTYPTRPRCWEWVV